MNDRTLRQLDRLALQGDLRAQTRHLLGRVRAGDLTRARVELAGWLGDPAARQAPDVSRDTLLVLASGHRRGCPTVYEPPPADLLERALARVEERSASPDWVVRNGARHMRRRLLDEDALALRWPGIPPASTCPLCLQGFRFQTWLRGLYAWRDASVLARARRVAVEQLRQSARGLEVPGQTEEVPAHRAEHWIRLACFHLGEQVVREAIRDDLVPWVLNPEPPRPPRRRRLRRGGRPFRGAPRAA